MQTSVSVMIFSVVILELCGCFQNVSTGNAYHPEEILVSKNGITIIPIGSDRSRYFSVPMAKQALCSPELQIVRIPSSPNTIYFPKCIKIKRCSGCCNQETKSCQPVEKIIRRFKIEETTIYSKKKRTRILLIEEHTSCECLRHMEPEQCTDRQIHDSASYNCICPNMNDENVCRDRDGNWFWDKDSCTCKCNLSCTTGTYRDEKTCRCIRLRG